MSRNVTPLVEAPTVAARKPSPWELDFLAAARKDTLYAASALALGFRRGRRTPLRERRPRQTGDPG
ncbi:hypothetical protein [Streptomyces sp. MCL20-2]|uniref:hypothetical protein n=1 Tax=Streptomyces sp. MCL20-2 TaxID=2967219 RepID=UPI00296720AC|nr:hypothetical protein [Streptomyces sp. MCL20-2]